MPDPEPDPLTGYFTIHKDGDAAHAARHAEAAVKGQADAAAHAARYAAEARAVKAHKAALKADSVVAVQQERAAHLSNAAQKAQALAFRNAALATRLSKALFALRGLESQMILHAKATRKVADSTNRIVNLAIKSTNLLNRIEADQKQVALDSQAETKRLVHLQSKSLDALANAQVAANHAHSAAEAAQDFEITVPQDHYDSQPNKEVLYHNEAPEQADGDEAKHLFHQHHAKEAAELSDEPAKLLQRFPYHDAT